MTTVWQNKHTSISPCIRSGALSRTSRSDFGDGVTTSVVDVRALPPGLPRRAAARSYSHMAFDTRTIYRRRWRSRSGEVLQPADGKGGLLAHLVEIIDLEAVLNQRKVPFCMRADGSAFAAVPHFVRSGRDEAIVTLEAARYRRG